MEQIVLKPQKPNTLVFLSRDKLNLMVLVCEYALSILYRIQMFETWLGYICSSRCHDLVILYNLFIREDVCVVYNLERHS